MTRIVPRGFLKPPLNPFLELSMIPTIPLLYLMRLTGVQGFLADGANRASPRYQENAACPVGSCLIEQATTRPYGKIVI